MLLIQSRSYVVSKYLYFVIDFFITAKIFVHAKIACRDMGGSLATVFDNGVNDWLVGKTAEWIHPSDTVSRKYDQRQTFTQFSARTLDWYLRRC